jgi:flagellar hook-length control protein FliK
MLTGILHLNTNGTILSGAGDNTNGMASVNGGQTVSATSGTAGEDNLNSHNFIAILSAILSGLNNNMTEAGNLNSSSFQILLEEGHTGNEAKFKSLFNSLLLTSDSSITLEENIANALNQAVSGIKLSSAAQAINTAVDMNGQNSAAKNFIDNFLLKTEEVMQKIKVHANANINNDATNNSNAVSNALDKQLLQVKAATGYDTGKAQYEGSGVVDAVAKDESAPIMLRAMELKHKHTGPEYGHQQGYQQGYQRNGAESMQSLMRGSELADKGVGVLNSVYQSANSQDAPAKESMHVTKLHDIGNSFIKTLNSGSRHLIINLEPPDLGSVQIKLKMTNGVLTANLKVDSAAVKELFSSALPHIKASLADSGIKLSDFFVDVKKEDGFYDDMKQHRDGSQHDNPRHKKYQEFKFDYFA